MFAGKNLWVFKPSDYNRGRGVNLVNSLDQLRKLVQDYTAGVEVQSKPKEVVLSPEKQQEEPVLEKPKVASIIRSDVFVIQKYMELPLLINDRKFDMRLWVLITPDHRCYLFKEGYIRTSSYKYTLESEMIENLAIHLTNNAIQKQDEAYGKLEDGN